MSNTTSGIVTPPIYNYQSPDAIWVYGEPSVNFGLSNRGAVNGIGLVTRGLAWQVYDSWFDVQYALGLSTSWAMAAGTSVSTSWSMAAGSSVSTTWTDVDFGVWGDMPIS